VALPKNQPRNAAALSACGILVGKKTLLQELTRETQNVIGLGKCFPDFFHGIKKHGSVAMRDWHLMLMPAAQRNRLSQSCGHSTPVKELSPSRHRAFLQRSRFSRTTKTMTTLM
jgi:hypothetical protein